MEFNTALCSFVLIFSMTLCLRPIFAMEFIDKDLMDESDKSPMARFISIYKNIPDPYLGTPQEEKQLDTVYATGGSPKYAFMHYESIYEAFHDDFKATSEDVFIDLGSGSGGAPILFSLCTGGKSIGIEFIPFRHELALKARGKLPSKVKPLVQFIKADMFNYPIPHGTIYMVNWITFANKYSLFVSYMLKHGPKKFCVWSIGSTKLNFPKENIKRSYQKRFEASWSESEKTTLYWIEL